MEDKQIKTQSGESPKKKNSDSKVLYVIPDTDEATEALLDEIYGKRAKRRKTSLP
ncbi:hypothetical protein BH18ACI4_BH18ACI4_11730 [soil metagenome]